MDSFNMCKLITLLNHNGEKLDMIYNLLTSQLSQPLTSSIQTPVVDLEYVLTPNSTRSIRSTKRPIASDSFTCVDAQIVPMSATGYQTTCNYCRKTYKLNYGMTKLLSSSISEYLKITCPNKDCNKCIIELRQCDYDFSRSDESLLKSLEYKDDFKEYKSHHVPNKRCGFISFQKTREGQKSHFCNEHRILLKQNEHHKTDKTSICSSISSGDDESEGFSLSNESADESESSENGWCIKGTAHNVHNATRTTFGALDLRQMKTQANNVFNNITTR